MTGKKKVLVLRTCNPDMTSSHGFVWPVKGPVACPDWQPTTECGHGLHGLLHGEGEGDLLSWSADAKWLVVAVNPDDIINLTGKVKFPAGDVVFCGTRDKATAYLSKREPGHAVVGALATAGNWGTATAGDRGTATAGNWGTATAGNEGTATAGNEGTATAGDRGNLVLAYWSNGSRRLAVAHVGDDGIEPGRAYRLNYAGLFVPVKGAVA